MTLVRSIPLIVLGLGLAGCQGFTIGHRGKPTEGETLSKLEATQPAGEKLPEIVTLPPATPPPAPAPVVVPTTVPAAAAPATTAGSAPEPYEEEIAVPRKPRAPRARPAASAAPASAHARTYTVQRGDTLQKISMKFYGTTKSWQKIYDANKGKLKKPDVVIVGTVLTIP